MSTWTVLHIKAQKSLRLLTLLKCILRHPKRQTPEVARRNFSSVHIAVAQNFGLGELSDRGDKGVVGKRDNKYWDVFGLFEVLYFVVECDV